MTWYWWKHWFWITSVLTIITIFIAIPISLADTYPITPQVYKEYKKEKLTRYPLASSSSSNGGIVDDATDIDDVFNGNVGLTSSDLINRERDNQIPVNSKEKDIITNRNIVFENNNTNTNTNISNKTHDIHSIRSNKNDNSSFETETNEKITKATDNSTVVINNNSLNNKNGSKNNSNNNNDNLNITNKTDNDKNSMLSTNSSLLITSNTSQPIITTSDGESIILSCNVTNSIVQLNRTKTNINNNNNYTENNGNKNRTIDNCKNHNIIDSNDKEKSSSFDENLSNNDNDTTTIHVDLIDDDNVDDGNKNKNKNNNNPNNEKTDSNRNSNRTNKTITDVYDNNNKSNNNDDDNNYFSKSRKFENITKEEEFIRAEIQKQLEGERGRKSKVLAEYRNELKYFNFSSDAKNLLARSATADVSLDFDEHDDGNVSSEALSIQKAYILDAGTISGICLAVLGLCLAITLAGIAFYRRRYLNKPQTLSEPDSSGYIDDSTIRDNSDEMYSLDNDSFLNSLEAMTIQNYWTDTVKHTKL